MRLCVASVAGEPDCLGSEKAPILGRTAIELEPIEPTQYLLEDHTRSTPQAGTKSLRRREKVALAYADNWSWRRFLACSPHLQGCLVVRKVISRSESR